MQGRLFITTVSALLLTSLLSCETEIDFSRQHEPGIAVYALATAGEPFSMRISRSFTVNDNPSVVFSDYAKYYSELDTLYHSQVVIKDAEASVVVNGTDRYMLSYNDVTPYAYTCDYVPKNGDEIAISVRAQGYNDVSATAKIETPQSIEIIKTEVVYKINGSGNPLVDDGSMITGDALDRFGVDSVMLITMRLHDPGNAHNYYRLKVRGIADREESMFGTITHKYYTLSDCFTSNDIIFVDNQLGKPYGDWEAGFSNVFDDHLFNGRDYTFTVETRKRYGDNARVVVELQSLGQDLYYFLKSYQLFRISTDDVYLTPIGLYSNINNGWGILGTLSCDRHTIYY